MGHKQGLPSKKGARGAKDNAPTRGMTASAPQNLGARFPLAYWTAISACPLLTHKFTTAISTPRANHLCPSNRTRSTS